MKCSRCKTELGAADKLNICPVCANPLELNPKPSFALTWAQIEESALQKKPGHAQFENVWKRYEEAMRDNPDDTLEAIRFLKRYPKLAEGKPDSQTLLMQSLKKRSYVCALELFFQDEKSHDEMAQIIAALPQVSEEMAMLKAAIEGDDRSARSHLRTILGMEDAAPIVIDSIEARRLLTFGADDLETRKEQINAAAEAGGIDHLIELLCRPLANEDEAFNHLANLNESVLDRLEQTQNEWESHLAQNLNADCNLRGIHLVCQMLKNARPAFETTVDRLLKLQYEKAYLRPFEEVAATDLKWI